jgi:phosphoinositide-3-kinase regulatory subunit 4
MGNQLASLSHQPDNTIALPEGVTFEDRLGGGQFLRTLKCGSEDGALVVKVYSKRESRTALSSYEEMLAVVRERLTLNGAPNVMPFRWFEETPQAAYLVRQYFHSNLLERMSTPPFLTVVEKRWLAFQLLQALQQCHAVGVCHGDVKAENIMVTSWNWLFLCDLANYKPSILPQDDPTIFNYFFATSRRACALAPERFVERPSIAAATKAAAAAARDGAIVASGSAAFTFAPRRFALVDDGSADDTLRVTGVSETIYGRLRCSADRAPGDDDALRGRCALVGR